MKFIEKGVCAPKGFLANGIHCGIRKNRAKKDLAIIFSLEPCKACAVYTTNKVCGAPIKLTKEHLKNNVAQAVLCNSGVANTCAIDGVEKAEKMCNFAANKLNIKSEDMIIASTGVIGKEINIEPVKNNMNILISGMTSNGSEDAALAIMTTDTVKKEAAVEFEIDNKVCKIGGISKGSGMIAPNMATMLCFITSDVNIETSLLERALRSVTEETFNMLSIDGDTSTNDMVSIMTNGNAENKIIDTEDENYEIFVEALKKLCISLVCQMAADGEGATKLLIAKVVGAHNVDSARKIAKSILSSNLVKTAMFGEDANWGRILCAAGYSGADIDVSKIDLQFESEYGSISLCENGFGVDFSEEMASKILSANKINIIINLNDGNETAQAYGCDLTYDYIKINGDYRT
ncbi:MAG: bifunctional ornithine acetyltransferase/N-acetylglutamate synthase [Clostridia bacterium]|nr:bifunctional ornithine acetyltransferase/N-acetylglutamate synthase [Clostridia bacterium]